MKFDTRKINTSAKYIYILIACTINILAKLSAM